MPRARTMSGMRALLGFAVVVGCQAASPDAAVVVVAPAPMVRPETPEQKVMHWLAAHPEVEDVEGRVLSEEHWTIAVSTATLATRCVRTKSAKGRQFACHSGPTLELRAEFVERTAEGVEIFLLEEYTRDGGVVARWLRFPQGMWKPTVRPDPNEPAEPLASWVPLTRLPYVAPLPPARDAQWLQLAMDGEPLDVGPFEGWDVLPVSTSTPGLTVVSLDPLLGEGAPLVCVRWRERWRCAPAATRYEYASAITGVEGDRIVLFQSGASRTAGAANLEFFAWTADSLAIVGSLQVGAMTRTSSDRVQFYHHTHAQRGDCIAIAAPETRHVETQESMFWRRDLRGAKFTRWPVPDRLPVVDGAYPLPHADEPVAAGVMPSWVLTGLWRLGAGDELVRVEVDADGVCPASP